MNLYVCKHQYFISLTAFYEVNIKSFELSSFIFSFFISSFINVRSKSLHLSVFHRTQHEGLSYMVISQECMLKLQTVRCNAQYEQWTQSNAITQETVADDTKWKKKGMQENNKMQRSPITNILRKIMTWRQHV